jgi:hypothetical protein
MMTVLLNGEIESQDMYFRNVHICQQYAHALQWSSSKTRRYQGEGVVVAYCTPKLINPETTTLPIYDH